MNVSQDLCDTAKQDDAGRIAEIMFTYVLLAIMLYMKECSAFPFLKGLYKF